MSDTPYRLAIDLSGCSNCGASRSWTIIGPDDVGIGTSWEDEQFASDVKDLLNMAYDAGRENAAPQGVPSLSAPSAEAGASAPSPAVAASSDLEEEAKDYQRDKAREEHVAWIVRYDRNGAYKIFDHEGEARMFACRFDAEPAPLIEAPYMVNKT